MCNLFFAFIFLPFASCLCYLVHAACLSLHSLASSFMQISLVLAPVSFFPIDRPPR